MRRRRALLRPAPLEKVEQQWALGLLRRLTPDVWVLGSRRAQRCWQCKAVTRDQGTRQTPGLSDIYAILPPPRWRPSVTTATAVWVEMKREQGSRISEEQQHFAARNIAANVSHVTGTARDLAAWLIAGGWVRAVDLPHDRRPEGQVEAEEPREGLAP